MLSRRELTIGGAALCGMTAGFTRQSDERGSGLEPISLPLEGNATPALALAVKTALARGEKAIRLPQGDYHFYPDGTTERFLHISNNDDAVNDIAVLLEGVTDFAFLGQETNFIFHGVMTPFVFLKCRNIHVEGLTIDWEVPFHVEARVIGVSNDGHTADFEGMPGFSYEIRDNDFVFIGEGFERIGIKNILEFDPELKETRYGVTDNHFISRDDTVHHAYTVDDLGDGRFRVNAQGGFRTPPLEGNLVAILPPKRLAPAFFADDTSGLTFERLRIHHAGCMGLICQTSEDISFVNCAVIPGKDRIVSTIVDATHFVNCSGTIKIEGCDFSNHIDDAVNVHGIYVRIVASQEPNKVRVEFAEFQQRGVRNLAPDDIVTFADKKNVDVYYRGTVTGVDYEDDRYAVITFSAPVPQRVSEGDVINVMTRQANVILRDNSIGKNRARGVLLSTAGIVMVEGNNFHTPGSAIRISGGVDHWYESGPSTTVMVRNNVFDHCKYGVWGRAVIDAVLVDARDADSSEPYHGTIAIKGNRFITHHTNLINAYRVDTLVFSDNEIVVEPYLGQLEQDGDYLATDKVAQVITDA